MERVYSPFLLVELFFYGRPQAFPVGPSSSIRRNATHEARIMQSGNIQASVAHDMSKHLSTEAQSRSRRIVLFKSKLQSTGILIKNSSLPLMIHIDDS